MVGATSSDGFLVVKLVKLFSLFSCYTRSLRAAGLKFALKFPMLILVLCKSFTYFHLIYLLP